MVDLGMKRILMEIDSSLNIESLVETIAHEMVHVKQTIQGQYRIEFKGRTVHRYWRGQRVKKEYFEQPWEQEAWSKEKVLAAKLFSLVDKSK